MLHALDLDAGDGAAFQAGQQDAAQAVADGDAEAALERLGEELAVGVGQGRAVGGDAVGQFQATPSDTHGNPPVKASAISDQRISQTGCLIR